MDKSYFGVERRLILCHGWFEQIEAGGGAFV